MNQTFPINLMRSGEVAEVVDVLGNDLLVAQLAERGLRKGIRLEMIAQGNPSILRVGETRLSFRCDGRVEVMVEVPA